MPTSFSGNQLFNVVLLQLSMSHNSIDYCHRKTDTTPKYSFYSGFMHTQWNEQGKHKGRCWEGESVIFFFHLHRDCVWGLQRLALFISASVQMHVCVMNECFFFVMCGLMKLWFVQVNQIVNKEVLKFKACKVCTAISACTISQHQCSVSK